MSEIIGDNAREALRRTAGRIKDLLDEVAETQEEIKGLKAEAKAAGYDLKAMAQIIREMRRGADYQAALGVEDEKELRRRVGEVRAMWMEMRDEGRDDQGFVHFWPVRFNGANRHERRRAAALARKRDR